MKKTFEVPEGSFTLEDQAFLKELGISGMPGGREAALKHFEAGMAAMDRIEKRADGLQALDLDPDTLARLAREQGRPVAELAQELRHFRDLEKLDED